MKKLIALSLALFATVSFAFGQQAMNRKSPHETIESPDKNIKVVYGRPSLKGRTAFGGEGATAMEKYGKPWRTGADEATEVTFKNDVMFGGKHVKAGTYTLVTIPNQNEWDVVLNSQLGQWGAYSYDKHKDKIVTSIKVPAKTLGAPIEMLTITPANNAISIAWDRASIIVPVMNHGK